MQTWLKAAVERGASDFHAAAGAAPTIRVDGRLMPIDTQKLGPEQTLAYANALLDERQRARFESEGQVDFSCAHHNARFRVNVYRQRGSVSIAARVIPQRVPNFSELGLPAHLLRIAERPHGLFLVTGPTGSGKSTTLAAMIDDINHRFAKHVVTLEDPIEYLHRHDQCLIDQREIGLDTLSFGAGLRAALRQDPDVILVGEMRDLETIATAITAAETGHLVLATLHTPDAPQTIDRIIDVFDPNQQGQIRIQLASVLLGVLSQQLLPRAHGQGRVAACELLVNTPAVANLIRTDKVHQIRNAMQTGRQFGMQTMEMHLRELLAKGIVSAETVRQFAADWYDGGRVPPQA
ncbi:type IV pilus twitching motility protein PilT [Alicyclobacillus cycloheptanicus]|uniref:type IV pilus twitching motility protein PilT n=1 Tax=Alicyclobacillus cycloheptanicus TaxID=1457 RepID=UPI002379CE49|nr:type IV pilus twitching motility protein PilT [Alicyclobacillus cycloheptanicus]WDM03081.1 type IV pilus twitching motility protein PilT [Alicyclobacillus cycloheptanicus]